MSSRKRHIVILLAMLVSCAQPAPESKPAAQVNAVAISMEQVDARIQDAEPETWQNLYEARGRALDYLIDEQLLLAEASRQGIDRDSLVRREILDKLTVITDSTVAAFYEENRQRMGGQSLDQMRDRIGQFLATGEHRETWLSYVGGLREAAQITIGLEPPRAVLAVGEDEPAQGPVDAPIVIVEYSDFECPYCARAKPAIRQVLAEYGDQVRLVYRDFPLSIHPHARSAAAAAQCAGEQDRFWEYHDVLFAQQRELRPEDLQRYATELGLDETAFVECMDSGRHGASIDADLTSGESFGVTGTPAFFINGRRMTGAQPFAAFKTLIDDELARLD